jgi:hypothetical protein
MHFLVEITYKAMGLLAMAGIQNVYDPLRRDRVSARLSADDPDSAADRVRHAVG